LRSLKNQVAYLMGKSHKIFWLTCKYRVFIKYCAFSKDFRIFRTLTFLCFPLVSVCVHTPGRKNTGAAAELAEFRKITTGKNTIFNEHPVHEEQGVTKSGQLSIKQLLGITLYMQRWEFIKEKRENLLFFLADILVTFFFSW